MTEAGDATVHAAQLADLDRTVGYLVADVRGLIVGRVEAPMYGTSESTADALSVRASSLRRRRRRMIPAGAIAAIDERTRVIGLRIERRAIQVFL
jgi:hypothetical protein